MKERILLGEVDFYGEKAKAFREVYPDRWVFTIETINGHVHQLLTY